MQGLIQHILEWGATQVISFIEATGELGVFLLMALESANIPIPSEIIMPFSGYAASIGVFGFWIIVLVGALGNLAGSLVSYWIGYKGGRPLLEKYGKYILVHKSDLEWGDRVFLKHGLKIAFWSRLLPVVRTFVSLPAGINKAPLKSFAVYTFLGSLIWSCFLTYIGFWLGENWALAGPIFERFSFLIAGGIVLVIIIYIWHHINNAKKFHKKHENNVNSS